MIGKKSLIIGTCIVGAMMTACVPAAKFEELNQNYSKANEQLDALKKKQTDCESLKKELTYDNNQLDRENELLKKDSTFSGKNLRDLTHNYDKLQDMHNEIERKYVEQQRSLENERSRLNNTLSATQEEMQRQVDSLLLLQEDIKIKEALLNENYQLLDDKNALLDQSKAELETREARVIELESLIAEKDKKVTDLQNRVIKALTQFEDKGLTIEQKNGKVFVKLESDLLFKSGSTKVDTKGKKALIKLAKVLESQKEIEVIVEGHTDADKLKSPHHPKNNWELSVLRATSVVDIMLSNSEIDKKTISAAGRGEFLPIDETDKSKNRRIEIILIPNLDDLYSIISNDDSTDDLEETTEENKDKNTEEIDTENIEE